LRGPRHNTLPAAFTMYGSITISCSLPSLPPLGDRGNRRSGGGGGDCGKRRCGGGVPLQETWGRLEVGDSSPGGLGSGGSGSRGAGTAAAAAGASTGIGRDVGVDVVGGGGGGSPTAHLDVGAEGRNLPLAPPPPWPSLSLPPPPPPECLPILRLHCHVALAAGGAVSQTAMAALETVRLGETVRPRRTWGRRAGTTTTTRAATDNASLAGGNRPISVYRFPR